MCAETPRARNSMTLPYSTSRLRASESVPSAPTGVVTPARMKSLTSISGVRLPKPPSPPPPQG